MDWMILQLQFVIQHHSWWIVVYCVWSEHIVYWIRSYVGKQDVSHTFDSSGGVFYCVSLLKLWFLISASSIYFVSFILIAEFNATQSSCWHFLVKRNSNCAAIWLCDRCAIQTQYALAANCQAFLHYCSLLDRMQATHHIAVISPA